MPSSGRNSYINTIFNTNTALQTHFWVVDHQLRNADLSSDYLHILTCVQTPQIFFFFPKELNLASRACPSASVQRARAAALRCHVILQQLL